MSTSHACPAVWKAVGTALWLRFDEDIRPLCIVGAFYALQAGRWRASAATVARVDDALFGYGDDVWIVLICLFGFFGATITHNCIHVPMFKRVKGDTLNKVWHIVLTNTYGWPVSTLIPGHNLSHHKFTQGPKDVMRTTKMRYEWNWLNLLLFVVHIVVDINKHDAAYFEDQKRLGRPIAKQLMLECVFFWPVQVILALLDWRKYLLLVFIPGIFGKWGIISVNLLQHDGECCRFLYRSVHSCMPYLAACCVVLVGCLEPDEPAGKFNFARNFTGRTLNYFTCNNGYHTIHHRNPGMHWTKMPV
jgi:fatty acid desaturase